MHKTKSHRVRRLLAASALVGALAAAGEPTATPPATPKNPRQLEIETWPENPELPDPFKFNDGSRVSSVTDWPRRREEIKTKLLELEFGPLPPVAPVKLVEQSAAPSSQPATENDPAMRAIEQRLTLATGPDGHLLLHAFATVPKGSGPFPVIIKGDITWGRVHPEIVSAVVQRGYILLEFDRTEVAPDNKNGSRHGGVWDLYAGYQGGAMSAWAWGFHRMTDYALTRADVDPKRIIITGHSRGGKAALLAGALDERVALTAPNGSGCGGGGCFRYTPSTAEGLARITKAFPHWFELNFGDFGNQIDRLPIDQHLVKSLVAPRALLTTNGLGDLWANPEGDQVTTSAARDVFRFLSATDKIGQNYRPGKHEHNLEDFTALLDFADNVLAGKVLAGKVLAGKSIDRVFEKQQFPDAPKLYSWTAPSGN